MTGFLEEAPGEKSSTRLIAVALAAFVAPLVGAVVWLAHKTPVDTGAIVAVGGVIITLVIHGSVAIVNRRSPDDKDDH